MSTQNGAHEQAPHKLLPLTQPLAFVGRGPDLGTATSAAGNLAGAFLQRFGIGPRAILATDTTAVVLPLPSPLGAPPRLMVEAVVQVWCELSPAVQRAIGRAQEEAAQEARRAQLAGDDDGTPGH